MSGVVLVEALAVAVAVVVVVTVFAAVVVSVVVEVVAPVAGAKELLAVIVVVRSHVDAHYSLDLLLLTCSSDACASSERIFCIVECLLLSLLLLLLLLDFVSFGRTLNLANSPRNFHRNRGSLAVRSLRNTQQALEEQKGLGRACCRVGLRVVRDLGPLPRLPVIPRASTSTWRGSIRKRRHGRPT